MLVRLRIQTLDDPMSGIWTGDWGTTPSHRNAVSVSLKWDGTTLIGAVNPGPHALPFTKAAFDSQKRAVHLEVDVISSGREVHYVIDGTIEHSTLIGTWYNDGNKGNFRLIRK
jgi:hypothetical protein